MPRSRLLGVLLGALMAFTGCREGKVETYRIPKEHDAEMATANTGNPSPTSVTPAQEPVSTPAGASTPTPALATASGGAVLTWTAPATWQPKPLGQMRKGSFTLAGPDAATTADLSISAFPGAVGGELANINRWRGQLSLAPIAESELPASVTRITSGDLTFTVVDIVGAGDQPQRILGAMTPLDQAMWFFKLSGPDALVASAKSDFLAFLKTVKASAPATP